MRINMIKKKLISKKTSSGITGKSKEKFARIKFTERKKNPFAEERYISALDELAKRLAYEYNP